MRCCKRRVYKRKTLFGQPNISSSTLRPSTLFVNRSVVTDIGNVSRNVSNVTRITLSLALFPFPETKRLSSVTCLVHFFVAEADSGAIEPSINHFGVDEEGHRIQEDERIANQTVASDLTAVVLRVHVNDTNNETPVTKTIHSFLTDHENLVNVSRMDEGSVAELQRDQSNLLSVTVSQNDVHEPQHNPLGSDAKPAERNSSENKVEHANNDFVSSTRPNRAEIASSIVPLEIRSPGSKNDDYLHGVQVDDEDLSNVVEHENELIDGSNVDKSRRENSIRFTTVSIRETIVTEVKPIEQKNVEDIRAISFQVPAIDKEAEDADKRQQDNEHPRNVMESRKDQSRPMNNLLLAGGKSTKAFYEIKPSIKTEMEPDQLNPSSTQRPLPGRKFVLPSVDSAFGKFGPYFEDGDQEINITARIGSTMLLDCKIGMLGNKEVISLFPSSAFRLLFRGYTDTVYLKNNGFIFLINCCVIAR